MAANAAENLAVAVREAAEAAQAEVDEDDRALHSIPEYRLAYQVGLEVHEAPRLARGAETSLPEGAVVTIEPGVYLPGWGGVRIEDDVHLAPGGTELLTHFTRDLIELS